MFYQMLNYLALSGISDISSIKEEAMMKYFINCYVYAALNEIWKYSCRPIGLSEDIIVGFFTNYHIYWALNETWKACE